MMVGRRLLRCDVGSSSLAGVQVEKVSQVLDCRMDDASLKVLECMGGRS